VIPFAALTKFYDPSVRFGLQFDQANDVAVETGPEMPETLAEEPDAAVAERGAVVSLDAFRKK
jgi:hypothetical protein